MQGQLTYEDTGLLDRTHLHLYTHHSLMALLSNAGYKVDALSYTFHDIPDEVLAGKLRQAGLEPTDAALARLHAPEAVAYQYIVEARAKAAGDASAVYPELTDKPLRDSEEVYRKVHERLHQAQVVSQRRAEVIDAKARQIAHHENQMMLKEQQLARKDGRIAELKAQVTNQDRRVSALLGSNAKQQQTLQQTQAKLKQTQAKLKQLQHRHAELQRVLSTRSWRAFRALTLPVRGAARMAPYAAYLIRNPGGTAMGRRRAASVAPGRNRGLRLHLTAAGGGRAAPTAASYQRWIEQCEAPREPDAATVKSFVDGLDQPPLISVVMPVYEASSLRWLRAASILACWRRPTRIGSCALPMMPRPRPRPATSWKRIEPATGASR